MKYMLAIDEGTTSARAILFNRQGGICATAQREFTQIFPQAGWVEHDPAEIWACQRDMVCQALDDLGIAPSDVAGIGITNQRETTLIWDRASGKPIHNAIVWQDRRTAGFCDELKADGAESLFQEKTGLVLDAYFSGTKARWILDNVPGARQRAEAGELAFGTIDTWLIWQLTGGRSHLTDPSNASRTLMFNTHEGDWDDDLLECLGVPRQILPQLSESSELIGETVGELFGAPIPISGNVGDQHAALFGQLCTEAGMAKNTFGTGCFLLMNTGQKRVKSKNRLLSTVAWRRGGVTDYALEGSVFMAGAVVQWLRDGLGVIDDAREVEPLAASVPDTGGVYVVPAFAGLGAPHWDPYARGTVLGLSRATTSAHLARACLEGIAFQVADVVAAMEADAGIRLDGLKVDGGASANNLMMQFLADLLGVPVIRPQTLETTALGAAYLAGLAVGFWTDDAELQDQWQVDRVFEPGMSSDEAESRKAVWERALERSMGWATE